MKGAKSKYEFSGRRFEPGEIDLVKETIATYPKLSQTELAQTVCEFIGWVQPSGKPKTTQCLNFLRQLAQEEELKLPALNEYKKQSDRERKKAKPDTQKDMSWMDMSELVECKKAGLEVVSSKRRLQQWRAYMSTFHSLGDPNVYGSQLRYIITDTCNGRDLGSLLFSASAWALEARDKWIGWDKQESKTMLHLVINNSRFLIFPWVRVKNLASRALSLAARRIQSDWLQNYCYAPVLMETFVDTALYKGTCYKAANWVYLGESKGRGRNDRNKEYAVTRKGIYCYPLQKDFRKVLMGENSCKEVGPHV